MTLLYDVTHPSLFLAHPPPLFEFFPLSSPLLSSSLLCSPLVISNQTFFLCRPGYPLCYFRAVQPLEAWDVSLLREASHSGGEASHSGGEASHSGGEASHSGGEVTTS